MHSIKVILPLLGLLAIGAVAKADTFNFSSVTLTENKGGTKIYGTVSGFVNIDPATGAVQSTGDDFVATFGATNSDGSNPTASYTFTDLTNPDSVNPSHGYIDAVFTATDGVTKFDLEFTDVAGVITLCSTTNGADANSLIHTRQGICLPGSRIMRLSAAGAFPNAVAWLFRRSFGAYVLSRSCRQRMVDELPRYYNVLPN